MPASTSWFSEASTITSSVEDSLGSIPKRIQASATHFGWVGSTSCPPVTRHRVSSQGARAMEKGSSRRAPNVSRRGHLHKFHAALQTCEIVLRVAERHYRTGLLRIDTIYRPAIFRVTSHTRKQHDSLSDGRIRLRLWTPGFGEAHEEKGPGGRRQCVESGGHEVRDPQAREGQAAPRLRGDEEAGRQMHGCYSPSPGTVYPTLQWLEDEGLVVAQTG